MECGWAQITQKSEGSPDILCIVSAHVCCGWSKFAIAWFCLISKTAPILSDLNFSKAPWYWDLHVLADWEHNTAYLEACLNVKLINTITHTPTENRCRRNFVNPHKNAHSIGLWTDTHISRPTQTKQQQSCKIFSFSFSSTNYFPKKAKHQNHHTYTQSNSLARSFQLQPLNVVHAFFLIGDVIKGVSERRIPSLSR